MAVSDLASFTTLSEREREVLRLLVRGHTVKSIAEITGRTSGAVNERLREARRKTGVGSSRELARLLASQENRDTKIGMGSSPVDQAPEPQQARPDGVLRYGKGALIMIPILLSIALAAVAIHQHGVDAATNPPVVDAPANDPILGRTLGSMMGPGNSYQKVRSEVRDPVWADPTERALGDVYRRILTSYGLVEPVRVICAATICEVAFKNGLVERNGKPDASRTNEFWQTIQQGNALGDAKKALNLTVEYEIAGAEAGYVGYLIKIGPK